MNDCDMKREVAPCPQSVDAADHAVKKVFAILGVNIDNPESVEEFREDLRFGKKLRKASDHGTLVMIAAFVSGVAYAIWTGLVAAVKGH